MSGEMAGLLGSRAEPLELRAGKAGVAVSRRQVSHQPDDLGLRRRELREPVAAHAGVELEMHADALGNLAVGDHELEAGVASLRDLTVRAGGAHDDDPLGAVPAPKGEPPTDGRDTEGRPAPPAPHA